MYSLTSEYLKKFQNVVYLMKDCFIGFCLYQELKPYVINSKSNSRS